MRVEGSRTETRRQARVRVNRAHVRAYLDSVRDYDTSDEMPEPRDARAMRPHIFGEERV